MNRKYNVNNLIKSGNIDDMKEALGFVVGTLTTQVEISQNEMNYEERFSHNWSDYGAAKAVRDFCKSFLCDLGIE
jgi:hypothetical protein